MAGSPPVTVRLGTRSPQANTQTRPAPTTTARFHAVTASRRARETKLTAANVSCTLKTVASDKHAGAILSTDIYDEILKWLQAHD